MTSLFISLLGKQPWFSTTSNLADVGQQPHHRERNRLKKEPPPEIFFSCDEILDTIRSRSQLTLRSNHSNATVLYRNAPESQSSPTNEPSMKLQRSSDSISLYTQCELKPEELKRTRAKTPVFQIGQLESKACAYTSRLSKDIDAAIVLAEQYQAVLPARGLTPCPQSTAPTTRRNGLRRVKCQDSLRDMVMAKPDKTQFRRSGSQDINFDEYAQDAGLEKIDHCHHSVAENYLNSARPPGAQFPRGSFDSHFTRRHSSDSETLLGSDSEPSPTSPALDSLSDTDPEAIKMIRDCKAASVHEADQTVPENEIGVQLCMDLLTNDLATALQRQHPLEPGNRVSGLQILLMIEAYESLQQKLRQTQHAHVMEHEEEHVSVVDDVLDHWLQALRSIYERSTPNNCQPSGTPV